MSGQKLGLSYIQGCDAQSHSTNRFWHNRSLKTLFMNCSHPCQAQSRSLPSSLQGSIFNTGILPPLSFHVRTWLLLLSHYVITDSIEQHSRSIPQPPKDNTWGDSRVSAAPATFPPQCRRRRYRGIHFPLVRLMKACLFPPCFRFAVPKVGVMEATSASLYADWHHIIMSPHDPYLYIWAN